MRWSKIITMIMLICFHAFDLAYSEEPKRTGQATMSFLNIDVGARAVAMGGAYISMDGDVTSLFWNPAGIAKIKGGALSLNQSQWIADMKEYAFAAAYGNDLLGTFGLSFLIMDNGEMDRTIPVSIDVDPSGYIYQGKFSVNQFAAGLAYGREITNKFSIGGQIKYVSQDLGDADILTMTVEKMDTVIAKENLERTVAFDFGTIYYTGFKDLRIAMSFRNFARSVKYAYESYELPLTFKIGIAMDVFSLFMQENSSQILQMSIDAVRPRDYTERIHLGMEYMFKGIFAIRGGYKFNYDEEGFSAGFGLSPSIKGKNIKIDYAYSMIDKAFGSVQRFSFGFKL